MVTFNWPRGKLTCRLRPPLHPLLQLCILRPQHLVEPRAVIVEVKFEGLGYGTDAETWGFS